MKVCLCVFTETDSSQAGLAFAVQLRITLHPPVSTSECRDHRCVLPPATSGAEDGVQGFTRVSRARTLQPELHLVSVCNSPHTDLELTV